MRVYVNPPSGLSRAMDRVAIALNETAASMGFEVTKHPGQADIVFVHTIGYPDTVDYVERIKAEGKKYVIIQYCLRSTQEPNTEKWLPIWRDALAVWSYYDLPNEIAQDGHSADGINFVITPLGAYDKFRPWAVPKAAAILTSGYVAESETVNEAAEASRRVGEKMVHLGPKEHFPNLGDHVGFLFNVNDGILSQAYARCKYVAGLRRGEGFELPAVEGLLSGARPICYDRPHYRKWFDKWAVFIPEGSAEEVTNALEAVFREPYREVTKEEIAEAKEFFSWNRITTQVWAALLPKKVVKKTAVRKRRLLWVGDAVISSGFARATHRVLEHMTDDWEIEVIGINFLGEPHDYPYRIHPAISIQSPRDGFGLRRTAELGSSFAPDVIVVQNDPWNVSAYIDRAGGIPVVATMAVDGANMKHAPSLNRLRHANFWTQYGLNEARRGGYTGPASVIPLGVDTDTFKRQENRLEMRREVFATRPEVHDGFIVGNLNRNQPRKRLDLTVRYFAEFVHQYKIPDAYLYLHVAPTGDVGYDLKQLMTFFGLPNRLILVQPEMGMGISERGLVNTYAMFDAQVNTGQGEGWGLTTMEGMACEVPQIVGDWSALGEWPEDGVIKVACTSISVTPNNINVIGAIPDEEEFVRALHFLYSNRDAARKLGLRGRQVVSQPKFNWKNISLQFSEMLKAAIF